MDIRFYMFSKSSAPAGVARLAGQVRAMGKSICIIASDDQHAENLSNAIWEMHDFLPHSVKNADGISGLTITTEAFDEEIIFVADDAQIPDVKTQRICLLFHAADLDIVKKRRENWRAYDQSGTAISYWAEQDDGKWVMQAEANIAGQ